jgi:hypothetical protein
MGWGGFFMGAVTVGQGKNLWRARQAAGRLAPVENGLAPVKGNAARRSFCRAAGAQGP